TAAYTHVQSRSTTTAASPRSAISWTDSATRSAHWTEGRPHMASNVSCGSRLDRAARAVAGDASEHRTGHQPGAAGIVEVEQSAHQLTGRIEAGNGRAVRVDHLRAGRDAQASEREGDAARHRVSFEWRLVDDIGPVRLGHSEPARAPPVLHVRIERHLAAYGSVILLDRLQRLGGIHI